MADNNWNNSNNFQYPPRGDGSFSNDVQFRQDGGMDYAGYGGNQGYAPQGYGQPGYGQQDMNYGYDPNQNFGADTMPYNENDAYGNIPSPFAAQQGYDPNMNFGADTMPYNENDAYAGMQSPFGAQNQGYGMNSQGYDPNMGMQQGYGANPNMGMPNSFGQPDSMYGQNMNNGGNACTPGMGGLQQGYGLPGSADYGQGAGNYYNDDLTQVFPQPDSGMAGQAPAYDPVSPAVNSEMINWTLENVQTGERTVLGYGTYIIGSSPRSEIPVLGNSSVSRNHAVLRNITGTLVLEDLHSANGTYIAGNKIHKAMVLEDGATFECSQGVVFTVHYGG